VFAWPRGGAARLNGKTIRAKDGELRVTLLPADLTVAVR
jgi:hypothetical protein